MIKFSNCLSLEMTIKLEKAGWNTPSCQCDLPNLSDLLAELEARGYVWVLNSRYSASICPRELLTEEAWKDFSNADTPEEACGLALLWVLEQGKGERE